MVAEGPRGAHPICPGTPGPEQAGSLLLGATGKLLPGAGAASGGGAPHNLCGPVGSSAGVHAAQPGRAPVHAGWCMSAMGKAMATPQLADAQAHVCRVRVLDPWLKNVETTVFQCLPNFGMLPL